ncbi:hypothetical protein SNEBB_008373 [Seison nebaliae]|nr:hypothetical protein SNEBB_008373 [Seison nebaliae]
MKEIVESPINLLSDEILLKIFKLLSPVDIVNISRVSRRWYLLAHSELLWQNVNFISLKLTSTQILHFLIYYASPHMKSLKLNGNFCCGTVPNSLARFHTSSTDGEIENVESLFQFDETIQRNYGQLTSSELVKSPRKSKKNSDVLSNESNEDNSSNVSFSEESSDESLSRKRVDDAIDLDDDHSNLQLQSTSKSSTFLPTTTSSTSATYFIESMHRMENENIFISTHHKNERIDEEKNVEEKKTTKKNRSNKKISSNLGKSTNNEKLLSIIDNEPSNVSNQFSSSSSTGTKLTFASKHSINTSSNYAPSSSNPSTTSSSSAVGVSYGGCPSSTASNFVSNVASAINRCSRLPDGLPRPIYRFNCTRIVQSANEVHSRIYLPHDDAHENFFSFNLSNLGTFQSKIIDYRLQRFNECLDRGQSLKMINQVNELFAKCHSFQDHESMSGRSGGMISLHRRVFHVLSILCPALEVLELRYFALPPSIYLSLPQSIQSLTLFRCHFEYERPILDCIYSYELDEWLNNNNNNNNNNNKNDNDDEILKNEKDEINKEKNEIFHMEKEKKTNFEQLEWITGKVVQQLLGDMHQAISSMSSMNMNIVDTLKETTTGFYRTFKGSRSFYHSARLNEMSLNIDYLALIHWYQSPIDYYYVRQLLTDSIRPLFFVLLQQTIHYTSSETMEQLQQYQKSTTVDWCNEWHKHLFEAINKHYETLNKTEQMEFISKQKQFASIPSYNRSITTSEDGETDKLTESNMRKRKFDEANRLADRIDGSGKMNDSAITSIISKHLLHIYPIGFTRAIHLLTHLKELDMNGTEPFLSFDVNILQKYCRSLTTLRLRRTSMHFDEKYLSKLIENNHFLQKLDLYNCGVGRTTTLSLKNSRCVNTLVYLNLGSCPAIDNVCVEHLSYLLTLEELRLNTCVGVSQVRVLKSIPTLRFLNIDNTSVAHEEAKFMEILLRSRSSMHWPVIHAQNCHQKKKRQCWTVTNSRSWL